MARPHIEPYVELDTPWKRMTLPGFPRGMRYKVLSLDPDSGACSLKVLYEPGFRLPGGMSYSEMELFVLSGSLTVGETVRGPGSYFFVPAGVTLPPLASPKGAQVLQYYNYAEPSFVESDSDHADAERDQLAIVDAYHGLQWGSAPIYPATAPGCLVKILRYNSRTQAFTFLYCMVPNFWQDNISYHDCAEESYHIWGTSWMMQFGELPTGGYFWRPPYINHGAFACKLGTLALGRTDSQLYNHFHFNPWSNVEENRERAASRVSGEQLGVVAGLEVLDRRVDDRTHAAAAVEPRLANLGRWQQVGHREIRLRGISHQGERIVGLAQKTGVLSVRQVAARAAHRFGQDDVGRQVGLSAAEVAQRAAGVGRVDSTGEKPAGLKHLVPRVMHGRGRVEATAHQRELVCVLGHFGEDFADFDRGRLGADRLERPADLGRRFGLGIPGV